ncbi:MAG: guanylate kinase [Nitrospinaceae bacterium]|nr:guanylate kinase [Nitrospinaceae bacterium]NIR54825.1 guanylate kinase [Nitrospinaceae bacterium]NIS85250.1 guanylate kinase [Nitrospinaceae bacterium]NIT82063.1 guanylate kinase [Nitrospinaceae bacterium]NIU44324.1 guanylate kinase [Nitrospinaceae bacterium]
MAKEGLPIILSAPSGAGKTTVCQALLKRLPDLRFSISHTTRAPRENEQDGVDYFFVSQETFLEMTQRDEFVEWAKIHNNYYGTARKNIEETLQQGKDLILELDVQGVESLRNLRYKGVFIFILPPSLAELEKRLVGRGTEPDDKIKKRLAVGKEEIAKCHLYDYIVTNADVEETVDTLLAIIRAEKNRAGRYQSDCPEFRKILDPGGL